MRRLLLLLVVLIFCLSGCKGGMSPIPSTSKPFGY
jgi:uncharacterized protein YceK